LDLRWETRALASARLISHWFKLIRKTVSRLLPYVRQTDESIDIGLNLKLPVQTLRERFLKHLGHALRTFLREKSGGVNISTQKMEAL
jgi:hypothetical protein